jgi:hypothetical protein
MADEGTQAKTKKSANSRQKKQSLRMYFLSGVSDRVFQNGIRIAWGLILRIGAFFNKWNPGCFLGGSSVIGCNID